MVRARPLHRDDPSKEPLIGNVKVTREDWLNVALDALVSDGVEQVKVLALGDRLGVSRSSFYWYFTSRQDLLDALLDHWEKTNTAALVDLAGAEAATITAAVCNVFRAVVNPALFDIAFDFAVRDWARRSGAVRRVLDRSEALRLDALTAMFTRHGYDPLEALTRARVLYYMQIGYNDADLREPVEDRLRLVPMYLYVFTGRHAQPAEIADFTAYARRIDQGETS
ncbi:MULTISPECIES: TetR/AcrR family transcriptional regulator [Rhodophyticola]|jgi:AcrR family transcriptional regulator|uniref:TetR/AcrR family transcriptional regulator n=1 Tax=Rhodophyticola TaxID=2680018 RepID=UPI001B01BD9C|nr:TetR/AcrR family transcriptional regulator [Roseicyclus sp.]MBO6624892.1 TetR/AcrR family transcriptional regulator [Roseicyclus sp.]MBO6924223.1 TetR/AcrR family transcriptional regulator [Roseicyclus sp.]